MPHSIHRRMRCAGSGRCNLSRRDSLQKIAVSPADSEKLLRIERTNHADGLILPIHPESGIP
jgi:hypothetical protein